MANQIDTLIEMERGKDYIKEAYEFVKIKFGYSEHERPVYSDAFNKEMHLYIEQKSGLYRYIKNSLENSK